MVKREREKEYEFQILHYYRLFSNDIMAVKGLMFKMLEMLADILHLQQNFAVVPSSASVLCPT